MSILEFRRDKVARESIYVAERRGATRVAGSVEIRTIGMARRRPTCARLEANMRG